MTRQIARQQGAARAARSGTLLVCTLLYGAASLAHHVHNAVYLNAYPHLPASLTAARVYLAWSGVAVIGIAGYTLHAFGHRRAGLLLLAFYGACGLYGLLHYRLAPMAAHTWGMNLTIGLEVASAAILLAAVALNAAQARSTGSSHPATR